jgi:protein-histidine N-methyltransferase
MLQIQNVEKPIYKRTLADVRFQIAQQDTLLENETEREVLSMLSLSGNSDLIKGVYEGGFKTWECSIDMVEYLSSLPEEQISNKKVLEIGCGSSIPAIYLMTINKANRVDIQDYNEQVIRYVSVPNILLNCVLNVQESPTVNNEEQEKESSSESEEEEDDDDDDDEEKRIEEDPVTCDAEAEIIADQAPAMLQQVSARTRAFFGDWSTLPVCCISFRVISF